MATLNNWHKETVYPFLEDSVEDKTVLKDLTKTPDTKVEDTKKFFNKLVSIENKLTDNEDKKKFKEYFDIERKALICQYNFQLLNAMLHKCTAAGVHLGVSDDARYKFIFSLLKNEGCTVSSYDEAYNLSTKSPDITDNTNLEKCLSLSKALLSICLDMEIEQIGKLWKEYCKKNEVSGGYQDEEDGNRKYKQYLPMLKQLKIFRYSIFVGT